MQIRTVFQGAMRVKGTSLRYSGELWQPWRSDAPERVTTCYIALIQMNKHAFSWLGFETEYSMLFCYSECHLGKKRGELGYGKGEKGTHEEQQE